MKNNRPTAVICNDFTHFIFWAKARRIRKFNSNRYIDSEGELYYPVHRFEDSRGVSFSDVEMAEGCNNLELFNECKHRVRNE